MNNKVLSYGERAVGLTFNPSNSPLVDKLKRLSANFIDQCNDIRASTDDPEITRMMSIAIAESQAAQMWAVKAATWQS